jgi:hypothetical protein
LTQFVRQAPNGDFEFGVVRRSANIGARPYAAASEAVCPRQVSLAENAGLKQDKAEIGGDLPAHEPTHDRVQRDARQRIGQVNGETGDEA